jgi:hypothetical protein
VHGALVDVGGHAVAHDLGRRVAHPLVSDQRREVLLGLVVRQILDGVRGSVTDARLGILRRGVLEIDDVVVEDREERRVDSVGKALGEGRRRLDDRRASG